MSAVELYCRNAAAWSPNLNTKEGNFIVHRLVDGEDLVRDGPGLACDVLEVGDFTGQVKSDQFAKEAKTLGEAASASRLNS